MKIAIAGASSFIGRHLIEKCINKGWKIIAVVRHNSPYKAEFEVLKNVSVIECNMDDYHSLTTKVGKVDCLVYLTWNGTRGNYRNDFALQQKNFEVASDTIHDFVNAGCKIVMTAGSQAEYGPWSSEEKVTELTEAKPNTEYGRFKLKLYESVRELCADKNIRFIEPRFFSLYGTDDFEGTMVISILKKMLKNEPCEFTECIQKWDFLHIDDAVAGLIKLIEDKSANGIYNFGSGESHELKHFVEKMYKITKSKSELRFGAVPYPETGIVNVNPCVEKLKELGWKPKTSFEEGINKIIKA